MLEFYTQIVNKKIVCTMQYNNYNAIQLIDSITTCNLCISILDEDIYFKNSKTQKPEK